MHHALHLPPRKQRHSVLIKKTKDGGLVVRNRSNKTSVNNLNNQCIAFLFHG